MSLENEPNSSMPESIQGEYLDCLRKGNFGDFKALMKIASEQPTNYTMQEGYRILASRGDMYESDWRRLKDLTGIAPQAETVNFVYNALLQRGSGFLICHWSKFLGTPIPKQIATNACKKEAAIGSHYDFLGVYQLASEPPELSDGDFDKLYSRLIRVNLNSLSEVINGTGVPVRIETVLEAYAHYLEQEKFSGIFNLKKITGVEVPEPIVKGVFRSLISKGKIKEFENFSRVASLKPNIETILEGYNGIAKSRLDITQLFSISEILNVPVPREVVDECYKFRRPEDWRDIKEKTGWLPRLKEKDVQAVYSRHVIYYIKSQMFKGDENLILDLPEIAPYPCGVEEEAKRLLDIIEEFTGVSIDKSMVLDEYASLLIQRRLNTVRSIMKVTGIEATGKFVEKAFESYFQHGYFNWIGPLEGVAKASSSEDLLKRELKKALGNSDLSTFLRVLRFSRELPEQSLLDRAESFMVENKQWGNLADFRETLKSKMEKPK